MSNKHFVQFLLKMSLNNKFKMFQAFSVWRINFTILKIYKKKSCQNAKPKLLTH